MSLNKICSACVPVSWFLFVCIQGSPFGVLFSGKDYFSSSEHSLVVQSSLYRVEAYKSFPCLFWHERLFFKYLTTALSCFGQNIYQVIKATVRKYQTLTWELNNRNFQAHFQNLEFRDQGVSSAGSYFEAMQISPIYASCLVFDGLLMIFNIPWFINVSTGSLPFSSQDISFVCSVSRHLHFMRTLVLLCQIKF